MYTNPPTFDRKRCSGPGFASTITVAAAFRDKIVGSLMSSLSSDGGAEIAKRIDLRKEIRSAFFIAENPTAISNPLSILHVLCLNIVGTKCSSHRSRSESKSNGRLSNCGSRGDYSCNAISTCAASNSSSKSVAVVSGASEEGWTSLKCSALTISPASCVAIISSNSILGEGG